MTEHVFSQALEEIHGVFARSVPTGNIRSVLWDRVREIPDVAVPGIVDRICDMERLPGNLSREFRQGWADWRASHPERILRRVCPECGGVGVRYCWAKHPDSGKWHGFVATCPACDTVAVPLRDLERRGVVIMPLGYPGGPCAFERDRGFLPRQQAKRTPEGKAGGYGGAASEALLDCVGTYPRPDARRSAHLPPEERRQHEEIF